MSKGPKKESYEVGPETKAMAKIFVAENQNWRQVWQPVFEQRLRQAGEKNVASVIRGRAAKSVMDAFAKADMSPFGLARDVEAAGNLAIGSVRSLQEANKRTLQLSNKAQLDALGTTLGFGATAGSGLAAAARFGDSAIMAQNKADMQVNTARSGIAKAAAKAAGSVAGGFALDAITGDPASPALNFTTVNYGSQNFNPLSTTSSFKIRG